jgi:hypothetical protein
MPNHSFQVTPTLRVCFIALIAYAGVAFADSLPLECPAMLSATSNVTSVPKGWTAVPGDTEFHFDNVAVFDGHPMNRASLVPDRGLEEAKDEKTGVSEWQFPGGAKDKWLGCSYRGTPSTLAIRIPDGTLKCSVHARQEPWGWQHERKFVCEKAT